MKGSAIVILGVMAATGCHHPVSPAPTTGLTGIVLRGPVTPVCRIDTPCDAPFSATFDVEQSGKRVAGFRSDSDGHFAVWLSPGMYRIIPGADAPLLAATSQAKTVEVGATGLTDVSLEFDTGIR